MRRRWLAVASAISLLLCFATVGLWVWGFWSRSQIGWQTVRHRPGTVDYHFRGLIWSQGDLAVSLNNGVHLTNAKLLDIARDKEGTRFKYAAKAPTNLRAGHYVNSTLPY